MEDRKEILDAAIETDRKEPTFEFKKPSIWLIFKTILKLIPVIVYLRRDRKEWVKKEGKNVNEKKFRKHAKRALDTFVALGPSYIKLGQWLSSRADLLPQPYLDVLEKLQDDVLPEPFSDVRPILEKELGPIDNIFEYFDTSALSGASLGQVYRAKYKEEEVVVKISRPNIEETIGQNIYILKKLLPMATRFIDENLRFSAEGMLSQFIETVHEEMDYRIEARNLIEIKNNLKDDKTVIIPKVYLDRTSRHVITLEYLPGTKVTDIRTLDKNNIDRPKLVYRIHSLFFKMLLRDSIFHADPHPGNISITSNGTIILYDFGMVGRLDDETRRRLVRLYLGLIDKDPVRTTDVLIELGTLETSVDRRLVEKGLELSIQSLHGKKVDRMEIKALQDLANKTLSRFPFRLPKNLALYMRMASILEGIYHYHGVRFQFVRVLVNLLEKEGLIKEAYFEEFKRYVNRFAKGIEISSELAPMIKQYLTDQKATEQRKKNSIVLPVSIISSSIFIGSTLIFPYERNLSYVGFAISAVLLFGALIFNKINKT
ncbi:MAG TPA: AarF/ABC1/UbiB kinase family protein [Nitrososphaeraceae archaeon]|jgi:predicted unusual protein kinase regulating ubiquinone biosynthesis (AarF/ABC1/UbiB family)|nr:AarF/ABC1/UbiB kinase family protein [Nitrososphaeraceae archaeon]